MFSTLLLCAVLCACVVLWYRARVRESRAHPLPPAIPRRLPIIGHLHYLLTDSIGLWKLIQSFGQTALDRGGVTSTYMGPDIFYFVSDPDDGVTVANACFQKNFAYHFANYWIGQGLVTGSAEIWQRHRKLLNPMFSLPMIHGFLDVFNSQARSLVNTLNPLVGSGKIDTISYLRNITLETSFLTSFGENDDKDLFSHYVITLEKYFYMLVTRFQRFWLHSETMYKLLGQRKKEAVLVKTFHEVSNGAIHKKRSQINQNTKAYFGSTKAIGGQPFVDYMLRLTNDDSLTDLEIREELDTIVVASYESSYNNLINMLALVGSYPEVQEKLYEEIMQVIGPERDVEKEELQKLVYTDAVIKETVRIFPPVPLIARYVDKEVKLKNYTLREGSQCLIHLHGINRHSSWGADAEQFRPERWLDAATLPKNPNAFAAFGLGKRSCIGRTYAMISAKVMLAHIVRKYRITADYTKMQFIFDITLKAVAGYEIELELRN